MINPTTALLVALAFLALTVVIFWPERGAFWHLLRAFRATERVRIEDALKHLFDCEYQHRPSTLQSIAGALHTSGRSTAELVGRMVQRRLVTSTGGEILLAPEGRSYALRVVRIHRLWERYLSEETGFEPPQWHVQAENLEHKTSADQTAALDARMGFPRYDPHGDPIPTAAGEITPQRGQPLSDLAAGRRAEIVHVEDEPKEIYAQLVAAGLHPGVKLRVVESTPTRLRFEVDTEEHVLAPLLAANVTVQTLEPAETMVEPAERLSSVPLGAEATVAGFLPQCRGPERRRLLDLGLIPGTTVRAEIQSPGGDPIGYRIRGAVIALRRNQAAQIVVAREPAGAAS